MSTVVTIMKQIKIKIIIILNNNNYEKIST